MKQKPFIVLILFLTTFLVGISSFNSPATLCVGDNSRVQSSSTSPKESAAIYWKLNGTAIVNLDMNLEYGYHLCSDGANGAIITWIDDREIVPNSDIYARRIDSLGKARWEDNGTVICNETSTQGDTNEPFENIDICSDMNGGAIITWKDQRDDGGDIYAQRIDSKGHTLWKDNGIVVCNSTNTQQYPKIISDGLYGAFITWQTLISTEDIYAQRINADGIKQWGAIKDYNGTKICNELGGDQTYPRICSDKNNGAIITWRDKRNLITNAWDIYAQRINSSAQTYWDDNGVLICNADNDQGTDISTGYAELSICSDENGGAIITWRDQRTDANQDNGADIYAQKINSTGDTVWDDNGSVVCNFKQTEDTQPQLCSDGNGGAIFTCMSLLGGSYYDIYAQRINSLGDTEWPDNGTAIANIEGKSHEFPQICKDGKGGAFITWQDDRRTSSVYDIYVEGINANGKTAWIANGTVICNEGIDNIDQRTPMICSDDTGDPIIIWKDSRDDSSGDIYAQRIDYLSRIIGGPVGGDDDDSDDGGEPIVPFGNFYVIFLVIGIVSLLIYTRHKTKTRN